MIRGSFSPAKDEEVLALTRRHPFFLYAKMAFVGAVVVLPLIAMWFLIVRFGSIGDDSQQWVLVTLSAVWIAYWVFRFVFIRYRYENEAWLVTDRRLVHVFRRHWFRGWTNTLELTDVREITVRRPRPFGMLWGYGDVQCWNRQGKLALVMAGIAKPEEIQAIVRQLQVKLLRVPPN
jgi:hypothetical protein